jgi:molybdate transport system substrate-binding protein
LVFAAASLANVMEEVAALYERESGGRVEFSFDGSSALARQIIAGAPADVLVSADEAKMDGLEERELLMPGTRRSLLANALVVVGPRDTAGAIGKADDLLAKDIYRMALADPAAVPAGMYARAWLQNAGLWDQLEARVIPLQNVRAALAAVESGNADIGFVYRTDAVISDRVRVLFEVPPAEAPDISYPVAVLRGTRHEDAARRFVEVMQSAGARAIFEQYGFGVRAE